MYIQRRVDVLAVLMLNLLDVLPKSDDVGRGLADVISLLTCMILLVSSHRLLHLNGRANVAIRLMVQARKNEESPSDLVESWELCNAF